MTSKQLGIGIAVAASLAVVGLFFIGLSPFNTLFGSPQQNNGLLTQDVVVGSGAQAEQGDTLVVNYKGQLEDGTVFDTSVGREPYTFVLGAGTVIAGWDEGLVGMQAGGKRLLVIPASLGYGASGYGPIPADATLIFEVDLLSIKKGSVAP